MKNYQSCFDIKYQMHTYICLAQDCLTLFSTGIITRYVYYKRVESTLIHGKQGKPIWVVNRSGLSVRLALIMCRAVGRSEYPGGGGTQKCGGYDLAPTLVEIGLTDLKKLGGGSEPLVPTVPTALRTEVGLILLGLHSLEWAFH